MSQLTRTVALVVEHHWEARCECGRCWNLFAPTDEPPDNIECLACGAWVRDLRYVGEHHSAGRDTDPTT